VPSIEKTIHEVTTARYPSLLLNLFASPFLPARKNRPDRANVIQEENKKGDEDSLYNNETGRQKRNAKVSIRSILLSILKINSGLISFIMEIPEFKATNIIRNNLFGFY
jgi:hypothetical protein